ncbi:MULTISPECIES: ATP-dependent nuclease [Pseudomonas]|uniref:ATP-dependent nuclease n=1 Tax=Pseudomonas TaxID=286 RepID=UPI00257E1E74|nr:MULTISPECIES: AAA family ATPase [Pseudomonas]
MYVPGLAGVPATEPYRTPAALRKAAARGDANAVLRNILWSLRSDNDAWDAFSEHLSRVFPEIIVNPTFDPNVDEYVDVTIERQGIKLPIDAAGTGFLQTVQILAYTAKYKPKLLLLDEPDSHIHPDRQRQLIRLLSELAEQDDFQVIVATHSRHLLDVPGAYFHWMTQGSRVDIDPDESSRLRVLTDLGALDSGDRLKNGNIDIVLLTEDSDQKFLKALMIASGAEEDKVQIWSYSGCTKIDAAVTLCRFINDHAPGTEVLVHRDRDYLRDEEITQINNIFSAKNIRIFLTQGTDAESHLINIQHIRTFYPQLSELQISQAIDEATEAVKQYSIQTLARSMLREEKARRKANGDNGDPDIVALTDQARADFATHPERWRHGKKTFGHMKSKLQALLGENPNIVRPSENIAVELLAEAINAARDRRGGGDQAGDQA